MMATDGSNAVSCTWAIPPDSPLQLYRMQTLAPGAWANIRFIFRVTTQDSLPAVSVDNLNLFYSPGALNSTTLCTEPPDTPPAPQLYTEFELIEGNFARVEHTVSAGDYVEILLLFFLVISLWGIFLLRELRGDKKLIAVVMLLLGSMTIFLTIIAGVFRALGFISDAFPTAFDQFERTNAVREKRNPNGHSE